jgi:serine/threonine kinase 17
VGVLAYELLSGYSPFAGDNKQETFCNISQCCLSFPDELFDGVSSNAKDFIQATLVKDPRYKGSLNWVGYCNSYVLDVCLQCSTSPL